MAEYLRYEIGVTRRAPVPDDDDDKRNVRIDYYAVGTLVHACLAYTSSAAMASETVDYGNVIRAAGCQVGARAPFDIGVIYETERLLSAYFAHYGEENGAWPEGVKILGVETHLGRAPLERRADAILELPSGEIVVSDTKTRAHAIPEARSEFVENMQTNDQFLGLSFLAQRKFRLETPPSVWVNAIIKTKVPKFDRVMVPFTNAMLDRWHETQLTWSARYLEDKHEHHRGPVANYSACAPPIGSRCGMFYWCHGSEEKRHQLFEIKRKAS